MPNPYLLPQRDQGISYLLDGLNKTSANLRFFTAHIKIGRFDRENSELRRSYPFSDSNSVIFGGLSPMGVLCVSASVEAIRGQLILVPSSKVSLRHSHHRRWQQATRGSYPVR